MIAFINEHRDTYGVEPICKVLPIARPRIAFMPPDSAIRRCCRIVPGVIWY